MPRPSRPFAAATLAALLAVLFACSGDGGGESADSAREPEKPAPAAPAVPPPQSAPSGPPPLSSRGTPVAGDSQPSAAAAAGLAFDLPAAWEQAPPASSMRLAQAAIPGPGGPGELAVFFFGPGGGGGVEANLERWIGQMVPSGEPRRQSFETHGLRVTWVEVAGTLKASTMGTGPASDQPGSRLFGAVVEGPGGPWFFKATGPDATLSQARDAWTAMLQGVRVP